MIRRMVVIGVPAVALVVVVLFSQMVGLVRPRSASASAMCLPTIAPISEATGPSTAVQTAKNLDAEQRRIAAQIIQIGKKRGIPMRGWQIALQAGYTESRLRDIEHGHADSIGVFQIRGMHGPLSKRTQVDWQINWFYDTLLKVEGWKKMRPGTAAQRVERSAYPDRYHQWEGLASVLITQINGNIDPSGCVSMASTSQSVGKAVQTAIAFAKKQLGEPYVWGAEGPNSWDCSSLMQAAYARANITLPRVSHNQYQAGKHVPLAQAQPGDLVFWGAGRNPEYIHHVGMYLGNDKVLHAPQPGESVEITTIWDGGQLLQTVTRPAIKL